MWTSVNRPDPQPRVTASIDNHALLRLQLNRVLRLYTPTKAYAQPHELAELVFGLSAQLRQWYQTQPLDSQFVRDATTFSMTTPSVPLHLVSLPTCSLWPHMQLLIMQ